MTAAHETLSNNKMGVLLLIYDYIMVPRRSCGVVAGYMQPFVL